MRRWKRRWWRRRRRCRLRRRRVSRGSGGRGRDLTAWSYRDTVPRKDGHRETGRYKTQGWGGKKGKRSSNEIMKAKW